MRENVVSLSSLIQSYWAISHRCLCVWNTYGSDKCCEVTFHLPLWLSVCLQENAGHSDSVQTVHCSHFLWTHSSSSQTRNFCLLLRSACKNELSAAAFRSAVVYVHNKKTKSTSFSFTFSLVLSSSDSWFWVSDTLGSLPAFNTRAPRTRNFATSSEARKMTVKTEQVASMNDWNMSTSGPHLMSFLRDNSATVWSYLGRKNTVSTEYLNIL